MKYARLTKEQFEELHKEFINFLASQTITATEWEALKSNKPELAELELDVFSDLVWEGVLGQAQYLEHISPQSIHLFALNEDRMHLIGIKVKNDIDVTTQEGFNWLRENLMDENIEFVQAHKEYTDDKNVDKFTLIEQGANITKGDLYLYMSKIIN
ncbi:hypothetical protein ES677_05920 [Bizionia gelidisalsuginis]|uniref:Histidyl-tRNA synthetase n=2 Tax=Bizionia TaxID=283785 RepID=A0A8H2LE84_9FLAO|nr:MULTISPECIES: DUF6495 family protein [Bizionia]TYB73148.1 hypothetical protein ES676_10355 [Bizionia saleffrena]TYC14916.1 hypothetical protein ES677_05920 [Bizionia gelidisalsuginis]